mmetsp:Transcript_22560/g.41979  ORF Transcript_22560/g.41979 Transcript_22560/m.41979 type:complete len:251 (+) Transcript_22560:37-789(+)
MNGLYAVAGAYGAIGRQLCHNIKSWGGTPLLIGRSSEKLTQINDELGGDCPVIANCDFSTPDKVGEFLASELKGETIRGSSYVVGSITLKPVRGAKLADYRDSYDLNVLGAVEFVKAALPGLKKGGSKENPSSIVLFSSVAASRGIANHSVIGSSKAAVEGLTVSLAAELAPAIRVNCVAPSLTGGGSEMAKGMTENEKIANAVAAAHPLPRLGNPADSAHAAAYLLSDNSAWTTGMVLPVDGGRSTVLK